jgi:ribosomal protein S18 acetylase RimI-like enzyme
MASAELTDLRFLRSSALGEMLEAEVCAWKDRFQWDFTASADLVRRFIDQRVLSGYALVEGERVVGYCYCVGDDPKGLIGDLFVIEPYRTPENENRLLSAAVDLLMHAPGIHRIETQLMMMQSSPFADTPGRPYLKSHMRQFMVVELGSSSRLPARKFNTLTFEGWSDRHQDSAAGVIASAYRSHIDADINDQYRSVAGARRFLFNIVQYPGCGNFERDASFVAIDRISGEVVGVSLASTVARDAGHITQICVAPRVRGLGVGYEMLRMSMVAFERMNYRRCSLTVTVANSNAVALYERTGFRTVHRFPALVWDGF